MADDDAMPPAAAVPDDSDDIQNVMMQMALQVLPRNAAIHAFPFDPNMEDYPEDNHPGGPEHDQHQDVPRLLPDMSAAERDKLKKKVTRLWKALKQFRGELTAVVFESVVEEFFKKFPKVCNNSIYSYINRIIINIKYVFLYK
jgi:hypothetical protein